MAIGIGGEPAYAHIAIEVVAFRELLWIAKFAGDAAGGTKYGDEVQTARCGYHHFPFGERRQRGRGVKLHRAEQCARGREDVYRIVATVSDIDIALGINVAVLTKGNRRGGGLIGGRGGRRGP